MGPAKKKNLIVHLPDGDMHVVEDGSPGAPVLLLIHGTAGSTVWWEPIARVLTRSYRVICVDLLGHGKSAKPPADYSVPAHARRVGVLLDQLGIHRVVAVGHSAGGSVVTALANQRRDLVSSLVLIDTGPNPEAYLPQGAASRLLALPGIGKVIWRLRSDAKIRDGLSTAFTRELVVPDTIVADVRGMTYESFIGTSQGFLRYIEQRSLPDRLTGLGLPVLVIFGVDDRRWRSSAAADYKKVPGVQIELLKGVGHTPMLEDPERTGELVAAFVAVQHGR